MEQVPPKRRGGYQASLLMRKIVHRGESLLKATVHESQLRNLADDLKDARSPKRAGEGQRAGL